MPDPTKRQEHDIVADYANVRPDSNLTDSIRRIIEERIQHEPTSHTFIHQQVLDCLRVLPSKCYGNTALSDNSNAILGDVYQFYNSSSNGEQHLILQNLQKRVEELCQRQDDRDAQILQLSELLKKSKTTVPDDEDEQGRDYAPLITRIKSHCRPEVLLEECEALAIARQFLPDQCIETAYYFSELNVWASTKGSAFLTVRAESLAEDATKDSAVAITRYLKEAPLPIAWYFSDPHHPDYSVNFNVVLQSLICQLVGLCPEPIATETTSKPPTELGNRTPKENLIKCFHFALSKLPRCFLIVEALSAGQPDMTGESCAQQLFDLFLSVVREAHRQDRALKILLVRDNAIEKDMQPGIDPVTIQESVVFATPMPLARARIQAVQNSNDLASILERAVLTAG